MFKQPGGAHLLESNKHDLLLDTIVAFRSLGKLLIYRARGALNTYIVITAQGLQVIFILEGYGLDTEVMFSGEKVTLQCEEHGIVMHFPEIETKKEIATTVTSLNISSDDCVLPDGAELVSAVYQISVSEALPSPVDVEIQHCVNLSNHDEALSMRFVRSNSEQGPPYQFTVIDGGQFDPLTRYGKIELSTFSNVALVLLKRLLTPSVVYATNLFWRQTSPGKYKVHVVVTKDLNDTIMVGF